MQDLYFIRPIGHVCCARRDPIDDSWDALPSKIELDPAQFGPDALKGLDAFSHVEIIFLFDKVSETEIETGARHPRGRTDWPMVGIFAQRGKNRPNRIGATICRVMSTQGTSLSVAGLDAIDGTPVVDIKPVMLGFLPRGDLKEPTWSLEIMEKYW